MFKKTKRKNKSVFNNNALFGGLIIFAVLLFISVVGAAMVNPGMFNGQYTAISTVNGEFYVGKASSWPFSSTIKLHDVFALQNIRSSADDPGDLQLIPLTNSLWQPKSISFNKDNIVFSGRVNLASQIAQTINAYKASDAVPQANPAPVEE